MPVHKIIMGKGYSREEIRQKLISTLAGLDLGLSGVELSKKLEINRITMTKYLKVFAAEGLLKQKQIGNTTLWFLESKKESFDFPADYFKVTSRYLESITKQSEDDVYSLIRNCLDSGAVSTRLVFESIFPSIRHIQKLYDDGKIGTSEHNLLKTTVSKSLQILNQVPLTADPKKNIVVISADPRSSLASEAVSAAYHAENWKVFHLGDMSMAINVLFDLDFQKLVGKIWKKKQGILIVLVLSKNLEGLNFFADAINPIKKTLGKHMKLVLCGEALPKNKIACDLFSENVEDVLQWSKTVSQNLKR